jgi:hypothetical protein
MEQTTGWGRQSIQRVCIALFLGIVAFFLLSEHTAHVFGVLPYLLILACPLMHLFMHHGHGGHGRHGPDDAKPRESRREP